MPDLEESFSVPQNPSQVEAKPPFFKRLGRYFWGILIVLAVGIAIVVIFTLTARKPGPPAVHNDDVKISVTAPQSAPSGSEINYEINIESISDANLSGNVVEVFYPSGFTYEYSTPAASATDSKKFELASIAPRQSQKIVVVGRLEGSISEVKPVSVKMQYIPDNFRATFSASAQAQTTILAPNVSLSVKAPPQVVSGQNITYALNLTNEASREFQNLVLRVTFPDKFSFISSGSPSVSSANNQTAEWDISRLAVGQSMAFSVTGTLSMDPGTQSLVQAELFSKTQDGSLVSAGRSFSFSQVLSSPLQVSLVVTRKVNTLTIPADLEYEIRYENQGDVGLNNVSLAVVFETPIFPQLNIRSDSGHIKDNSLVWTPAANQILVAVPPGAKGTFRFEVNVPETLISALRKNPLLKTRVQFSSQELSVPISGNTLEYKFSTDLEVEADAVPIAGPNPPVAGQSTTYRVSLSVTNTVNDVDEAELTAVVPEASVALDTLSPQAEVPNVSFNPGSGLLHWQMGQIFAFSGSFHDSRKIQLNLIYTPPAGQNLYGLVPLLRGVQVTGTDNFTNETVNSNKINQVSPRMY